MITEQALQEAIAECQGKRDPNREDCMMLAAFYTIQDHLFPSNDRFAEAHKIEPEPVYSFAPAPPVEEAPETVGYYGDSDFLRAVSGKDPAAVWSVMDELMDTLRVVNDRVYRGVMRKIG